MVFDVVVEFVTDQINADNQTSVPGVYAAGDATTPMQQVIVAAASGAVAAMRMNHDLAAEDFGGG